MFWKIQAVEDGGNWGNAQKHTYALRRPDGALWTWLATTPRTRLLRPEAPSTCKTVRKRTFASDALAATPSTQDEERTDARGPCQAGAHARPSRRDTLAQVHLRRPTLQQRVTLCFARHQRIRVQAACNNGHTGGCGRCICPMRCSGANVSGLQCSHTWFISTRCEAASQFATLRDLDDMATNRTYTAQLARSGALRFRHQKGCGNAPRPGQPIGTDMPLGDDAEDGPRWRPPPRC